MKPEQLKERSGNTCELCKSTENLTAFSVPFSTGKFAEEGIYACANCIAQIEKKAELDLSLIHI
jgi:protein PhnA